METSFYLTLMDEIALEGLQGITFESLWIRLQERDKYHSRLGKSELFSNINSNDLYETIFKVCVKEIKRGNLKSYRIPNNRPKISIYDRNEFFVLESGTIVQDDAQIPDNLSPSIVSVNDKNVKGSAADFSKRTDISEEITKLKSYREFKKQFSEGRVIIVASQKLRAIALFGLARWQEWSNMKLENYILLESIGQKRWYGELNLGKEAPKFTEERFKVNGFYQYVRKHIRADNLIYCCNNVPIFVKNRRQVFATTITYLVRFRPLIINQNDPKIIEISSMFRNSKRTKIPLNEFAEILKPLDVKCPGKIREFLNRYPFFKVFREETEVFIEYLRPLDQPLDYDDLHEPCEPPDEDKVTINDELDEDIDGEELDISQEIKAEPLDSDEENGFEEMTNSGLKLIWSNTDSLPATKIEDEDFDYDSFFDKSVDVFKLCKPTCEGITNNTIKSNIKTEVIRKFRSPKLFTVQITDRKLSNCLKIILPKRKLVKARDDQTLQIFTHRSQQLTPHFRERFFWILSQIYPVSRCQLIQILDVPSVIIRGFLKYLETTQEITHITERRGREMLYKYLITAPASVSCQTKSAESLNGHQEVRIQLIKDYFRQNLYVENTTLLRTLIRSHESNLSFKIDNRSIKNILNRIKDEGYITLFYYCFSYSNTCIKTRMIAIRREANQEAILKHFMMKSLFFCYGRYPVDLKADIKITSLLDDNGNFMRKIDIEDIKNNGDDKLEALVDPELGPSPSGRPFSDSNQPSRLERMFEMYRLLHFFLVDNQESNENFPPDDWKCFVPKLTDVTLDRQFLITDIMPYIPLVKLPQIVAIRTEIPGLSELMDPSIPSNHKLTLYNLPPKIRSHLLFPRKVDHDIQETLLGLSYFSLISLPEGGLKPQKSRSMYRFNTRIKIGNLPEYDFENLDQFDKFTETIYNHILDTQKCENCPFDSRLNLHLIRLTKLAKYQRQADEFTEKKGKKRKETDKGSLRRVKKAKLVEENEVPVKKRRRKRVAPPIPKKKKKRDPQKLIFRSKWNREEDNFLLQCHLASCFADTSGDILFDGIKEYSKKEKNILACRRRTRFLLKRKPFQLLIKSCLYELKASNSFLSDIDAEDEDPSLPLPVRKSLRFKRVLQKVMEFEFINSEHFRKKETHPSSESKETVNLDLGTILSEYNIINLHQECPEEYFCEPKNYYDIHSYIITNILLSSLILIRIHQGRDKKGKENILRKCYMRNVFKALRHFPKTLIKLVLKRLIQFRFISHNKREDSQDDLILSYAYKLNENLFLRLISSHDITFDLKFQQFFEGEKCRTIMEANNTVISAMEFSENLCVNVLELASPDQAESRTDQQPKIQLYPPTLLEDLRYEIDIPENFIRIAEKRIQSVAPMKSNRSRKSRGSLITRDIKAKIISEPELDTTEIVQPLHPDSIDDMSVIHCKVRLCQTAPIQEFFRSAIELLKLHLQTFEPGEFSLPYSDSELQNHYDLFQEYQDQIVLKLGTNVKFLDLLEFVKQKKELGINIEQLLDLLQLQNMDFETVYNAIDDFMFTCQKNKILFSVGIATRTFVHRDFINYWLVHSFKNLDIDAGHLLALEKSSMAKIRKIQFLPKLWRALDGHLNIEVLFLFFSRLIGFLVQDYGSGCELEAFRQFFHPLMPNVQLEELLKMLEMAGCIQCTIIVEPEAKKRTTLEEFLVPIQIDQPEWPDIEPMLPKSKLLRQKRKFFYEAAIDSYSRLATFYHNVVQEFEQ